MENVFIEPLRFESDIYVGDYTQYTKSYPTSSKAGVCITSQPPLDILSLRFVNKQHIPVLAINFEKNLHYFDTMDKGRISNCECMLVSDKARKKGWLVLAELKYCGGNPRTIMDNFEKALSQLKETFLFLRDVKHLFADDDYRYHWVISMPEHDDLVPFSQFYPSPEKILEYKDLYHVNLISTNEVEIRTHQHLRLS